MTNLGTIVTIMRTVSDSAMFAIRTFGRLISCDFLMRDTMYMQIMFDMAPNISNNMIVNINEVSPGSNLVLLDIDINIVTLLK